jgi:hypothetical protein
MINRVGHKKLRDNYLANIRNMDKRTSSNTAELKPLFTKS